MFKCCFRNVFYSQAIFFSAFIEKDEIFHLSTNRIRAIAKLKMEMISDRTVMVPAKNENNEKAKH